MELCIYDELGRLKSFVTNFEGAVLEQYLASDRRTDLDATLDIALAKWQGTWQGKQLLFDSETAATLFVLRWN